MTGCAEVKVRARLAPEPIPHNRAHATAVALHIWVHRQGAAAPSCCSCRRCSCRGLAALRAKVHYPCPQAKAAEERRSLGGAHPFLQEGHEGGLE